MGDKIYTPCLFFSNLIFVFKSPWCEWEAATPRSHCLQVPLFRRLSAERNNSINFNYYFLRVSLWWCLYAHATQTHTHSFNFTLKLFHWGTQTFEWREQMEIGGKFVIKAKMFAQAHFRLFFKSQHIHISGIRCIFFYAGTHFPFFLFPFQWASCESEVHICLLHCSMRTKSTSEWICTSLPKHSPSFPSLSWSFQNLLSNSVCVISGTSP